MCFKKPMRIACSKWYEKWFDLIWFPITIYDVLFMFIDFFMIQQQKLFRSIYYVTVLQFIINLKWMCNMLGYVAVVVLITICIDLIHIKQQKLRIWIHLIHLCGSVNENSLSNGTLLPVTNMST